jgi:hypothetical protein
VAASVQTDRAGERRPLLDRGTELSHSHTGEGKSRVNVKIWPSCGEGTITLARNRPARPASVDGDTGEVLEDVAVEVSSIDNTRRAVGRAKGNLRRYCVHSALTHMLTLTYRNERVGTELIGGDLLHFRRRLNRAWVDRGAGHSTRSDPKCSEQPSPIVPILGERWPYATVIEWGTAKGRLHLHMAVAWWKASGAVEVCERCATPALRAKRAVPAAGAFCVGCLWGHGFVGEPQEDERTDDPRRLASYLSKYASKAFDDERRRPGQHAYRVAEGFQPVPERAGAWSVEDATDRASVRMGAAPTVEALHETVPGWDGPPVWSMRWEVSEGG